MGMVWFIAGSGKRSFDLAPGGGSVVIGRSEDATLYVNSPRLSRRHCQVLVGPSGLELQDLGSANGTFLNGRKVDRALLRTGDVIQVGGIAITVEVDPGQSDSVRGADFRCERCGRQISMATVDDGQVFELGERVTCPSCTES